MDFWGSITAGLFVRLSCLGEVAGIGLLWFGLRDGDTLPSSFLFVLATGLIVSVVLTGFKDGGGGRGGIGLTVWARSVCALCGGCFGWDGGRSDNSVDPSFFGSVGVVSDVFMYGCLGSSIGWNFFFLLGGFGGVLLGELEEEGCLSITDICNQLSRTSTLVLRLCKSLYEFDLTNWFFDLSSVGFW